MQNGLRRGDRMTEEGFNNMEFLLNKIFIELKKSNELKERELRQQLFFKKQ